MKKEYTQLETFQLVRPCPIKMDGLDPAARESFCQSCQKTVYNLSVMPTKDAEALLTAKARRGCFMFFRNDDGRIITDNCPTWLKPVRRGFRMAAVIISLLLIWLLTLKKAIAQNLVGVPIDPRWGCPSQVPPSAPLHELQRLLPLDERALWTSGLSLLAAWCTWLALLGRSKTEAKQGKVALSSSFSFLTAMLVVIFAPCILANTPNAAYVFAAPVKSSLLIAGPVLALCLWFWTSITRRRQNIAAETIALTIAIPVSIAAWCQLGNTWWNLDPQALSFYSLEMCALFTWAAAARFIDAVFNKEAHLTVSKAIVMIAAPPLIVFIYNQVLLDVTYLIPATVGLSCLAILFRNKILATTAATLYAPPYLGVLWSFILANPTANSQLADLGYDTARDIVRLSVALALAFACACIWWHKLKKRRLSAQTLLLLLSIPILVHLIGTYLINNFGGLHGGF